MQLPCAIGAALVAITIAWQDVSFAGTTWDGGGANTNIDTADNWNDNVAPTLTGGSSSLTFGTGGSTAAINTNVNALGITINRDADFTIADGAGTLTLQSSGVTVTLPTTTARTHSISESVILGASQTWTVTNNVGLANLSVDGVISDGGSGYSLTKAGSGVLTLSASNTYTGGTIISAGTVALSGAGRLASTGTVSLPNSGATFDISGANGNVGIGILSGAVGSAVRLGNNTFTISNGNNQIFGGVVSGSGGIVLSSGILRLTGSNTYTGPTVVNGGILVLQWTANRLSPSTVVNLNGGQIDLNSFAQNWAGLSGSAAANIYSFNTTAGSIVLTVASGTSYTYAGTLGTTYPGFSVVKNGDGTQVFTNASNTYNQGTTLNAGTLGFANGSLGSSGSIRLNGGVLRWEAGNTQDVSARLALASGSTATLDTNGNNVTLATGFGGGASAALVKAGAGTLTLSGSNSFTGSTTISAGVLSISSTNALASTSDVNVAGGAGLTYTGTTGAFNRNITVTGGTGTVRNSGGGTLTLGGTLTKNGTVLRLTGGAFNVTGQIVGANANSDLIVDGTSTVTLSNTNTYNGPTFVNQSSNLIVNLNDAIPSGSVVTLGNATTTGTLTLGTFTDSIGQLVFSGSGGTLRMAANQTAGVQLSTTAALTLGSGATLDLTGMQTSAGQYRLINYTSRTGTFGGVTGLDSNYLLRYDTVTANELTAQRKADQATTFTMTTGTALRALVNSTVAVSGSITNSTPSGGSNLTIGLSSGGGLVVNGFGSGTDSLAPQATTSVTGTIQTGATAGTLAWSVINTDNNAITTTSTASGSLTVVNDRTFTTPSIAFGRFLNTTSPLSGTSLITSTGLSGTTANATIGGFGSSNGLTLSLAGGTNAFTGLVTTQTATYTTTGSYSGALGGFSGSFGATATNEFGGTSAVTVVYTGTAVNQRTFSVINSGTINLGNFLRTAAVTGSATISSTGLNATTANASLGAFSGTSTNGFSLATNDSTAFNGGSLNQSALYTLSGSAASAGTINGTFTSHVTAELGSINPVSVALVGTALDPATAVLASGGSALGNAWTINLGEWNQGAGTSTPWDFAISNLLASELYTADLVLDSFSTTLDSGAIFMSLSGTSFQPPLVAGSTNSYTAWISLANAGTFTNTYQLTFKSAKDGQVLGGSQNVSLTVTGIIVVPEPGAIALAAIGIAAGIAFRRRRT